MLSNQSPHQSVYRIANIVVNTHLNTIEKQGETIRVEPRVMQLLDFFVKHQGKVCSKQDILDEIWPRQIVADDAITRLIFVLRNILGDEAKSPTFISTIPKKGYVFLVEAEPLEFGERSLRFVPILSLFLLIFCVVWYYFFALNDGVHYDIERSLPITHQEGREYDYAIGEHFSGYFHHKDDVSQLVIVQNDSTETVLVEDNWNKRSLIISGNSLLYVRFQVNHYQIVQQSLEGDIEVLFESSVPIYTLSIGEKGGKVLFNQYKDNEHILLHEYSFVSQTSAPVPAFNKDMPKKIYSHFYQKPGNTLFFVGVDARKPTIYGIERQANEFVYKINGFDQIASLAGGRTAEELIVTGIHRFTQGIWSVSLETGEISLVYSHQESDIVQAFLGKESKQLYYSFQGRRADMKKVDLKGNLDHLSKLNSTLVESAGSYSDDGKQLYFSSDRSGDFELYSYQLDTRVVSKLTQLHATTIWHYSVSNDQKKIAIVYSTDQIKLGLVDLNTGNIIRTTVLEEIKFPLAWSKNDEYIYISEHRSNIAMYMYDAANLTIKKKREHLGLTAFEVSPNKVLAFDYPTKRFVAYDFNSDHMESMSDEVQGHMSLAPFNSSATGDLAMLVYSDGLQKSVYRLHLSKDHSARKEVLVANLLQSGNMQSISPDMSSILLAEKHKNSTGNIVALQLK